ncbi:ABC transporter E family member 2-like [Phragmites australis]|uniref:ABC transporter E family member 2-like n=1 Tax=Phragmites australis TaxID=29695 RepID=UPI002D79987C|nr:ABC transporter E family member 2-like [Phragmites australis]
MKLKSKKIVKLESRKLSKPKPEKSVKSRSMIATKFQYKPQAEEAAKQPSCYLDVKQWLKAAQVIRSLLQPKNEHDLSILDYLSDCICCMYGSPGAYGVVTLPSSVGEGINIFLNDFIPIENMRFREEKLTFRVSTIIESTEEIIEGETYKCYKYPTMMKTRCGFKLSVIGGSLNDSQISVLLAENGTAKTTFIRMLAGQVKPDKVGDKEVDMPSYTVSYKPQELISKITFTVRELLHKKIPGSCSHALFRSNVMKPLNIEELMDGQVANLSGGELQRVALCLCLGKVKLH